MQKDGEGRGEALYFCVARLASAVSTWSKLSRRAPWLARPLWSYVAVSLCPNLLLRNHPPSLPFASPRLRARDRVLRHLPDFSSTRARARHLRGSTCIVISSFIRAKARWKEREPLAAFKKTRSRISDGQRWFSLPPPSHEWMQSRRIFHLPLIHSTLFSTPSRL